MLEWLSSPEWIKSLLSSATFSALFCFIIGTIYKARVEKAIQHRYDVKLEIARAEHAKAMEELRTELRAKSEQLAALQSSTLNTLSSRHVAIDKRRLEAIEKIWAATVHRHQFKPAARMVQSINMDVAIDGAAKQGAEGDAIRRFANEIWNAIGLDKLNPSDNSAAKERPFLSPLAWALYSTYVQVLAHPVAQLAVIRSGVDSRMLADPKPMLELVKTALPHQAQFIDKQGTKALPFLVEELEETLLAELRNSLQNFDPDNENVSRTADMLKASEEYLKSIQTPVTPPKGLEA